MDLKGFIFSVKRRLTVCLRDKLDAEITQKTIKNITRYKDAGEQGISCRLNSLDWECTAEKALDALASGMILGSAVLGLLTSKKWFLLSGTVGVFILTHVLTGWCPPYPLIRKAGLRTSAEIIQEKMALKFYRGDFKQEPTEPEAVLNLIRKN